MILISTSAKDKRGQAGKAGESYSKGEERAKRCYRLGFSKLQRTYTKEFDSTTAAYSWLIGWQPERAFIFVYGQTQKGRNGRV